jgi:hypothetical protein
MNKGPNGERVHPKLGRLASWDNQNAKFPVRGLLAPFAPKRDRAWRLSLRLDQGNTSACTGNARTYDLAADPVPLKNTNGRAFSEAFAQQLYNLAKTFDEWPGEDYDGSSVLGALKAAKSLGYIGEYRWAMSIDEVNQAVSNLGPVVMGTEWLDSMFDPDSNGLIKAEGSSAGGHSYIINAVNQSGKATVAPGRVVKVASEPIYRVTNSWGRTWGYDGTALLRQSDLADLLAADGEAAITTIALHR